MLSLEERPCPLRGRPGGARAAGSIALALLGACASAPPTESELAYARSMSPSVELATTPTEEAALERAATLPAGRSATLDGGSVVPGPIYAAASGRRCRELTFGSRTRLACEDRASDGWVFVPDVFGAEPMLAADTEGSP